MTKADCHKSGCEAAGHVLQCAGKKDCPLEVKKSVDKKDNIRWGMSSAEIEELMR